MALVFFEVDPAGGSGVDGTTENHVNPRITRPAW